MDLATALRVSMNEDRLRPEKEVWRGPSRRTDELEAALMGEWAERRGVVRAHGHRDWRRLLGKQGSGLNEGLPKDDHVTMWRRPEDHGCRISIWVSQPYPFGYLGLVEMVEFAQRHGLEFTVSMWPAWHFPGSVLFVEWTRAK